jgi:predicted nucleic acid-binding protein
MKPVVVSNSTPLIALASIGRFSALRELFKQVHVPQAVFSEVAGDKRRRAGSREIRAASWINTVQVENIASVDFLRALVDHGEAESIVLSRELNADILLIDDKDGRKIAESSGITCVGTVGLLLRYYRLNADEFKAALDELIAKGFRLAPKEYRKIVQLALQRSGNATEK